MVGIDWLFIGGASSIVGVALVEKLADDYGINWVGRVIRVLLPVLSLGASLTLFDVILEVFLR